MYPDQKPFFSALADAKPSGSQEALDWHRYRVQYSRLHHMKRVEDFTAIGESWCIPYIRQSIAILSRDYGDTVADTDDREYLAELDEFAASKGIALPISHERAAQM